MPSYPGISSEAFRHPLDREAEQALRALPGFDLMARKFLEVTVDRPQYIFHMGNSVRVGPRQYAALYTLFRDCLQALDIQPEPAFFVTQNPAVNAYTIGQEQPSIVVTSGLLDLMEEPQLRAVIAHELGHLKCGHGLLTQMAVWAMYAASLVGQMTLGVGNILASNALILGFYEWKRKAELSSDRAALLVTDDLDAVLLAMAQIAGGSDRQTTALSLAEFKRQARAYQDLDSDALNQAYKFLLYNNLPQGIFTSHPFPVERVGYLEAWAQSDDYAAIRRGQYPRESRPGAVDVTPEPGRSPQGSTHNAAANGSGAADEAARLRRQIEALQREIDRLRSS